MNKMWNLFGVDTAEDEEYDEIIDENGAEEEESVAGRIFNRKNKVTAMPGVSQVRMNISQPTSFEQSQEICEHLKEKKSVIVNLEYVNKDVARRIVDFMSGAVQALDGHIEKISNSIFLFAPMNYDISSESTKEEIRNKLNVSWLKNG